MLTPAELAELVAKRHIQRGPTREGHLERERIDGLLADAVPDLLARLDTLASSESAAVASEIAARAEALALRQSLTSLWDAVDGYFEYHGAEAATAQRWTIKTTTGSGGSLLPTTDAPLTLGDLPPGFYFESVLPLPRAEPRRIVNTSPTPQTLIDSPSGFYFEFEEPMPPQYTMLRIKKPAGATDVTFYIDGWIMAGDDAGDSLWAHIARQLVFFGDKLFPGRRFA